MPASNQQKMPSHETLRMWAARAREEVRYVHMSPDELEGLLEQLEAHERTLAHERKWGRDMCARAEDAEEQYEKKVEHLRQCQAKYDGLEEQLEALRNFNEATRAAYATLMNASGISSDLPEAGGAGPGPLGSTPNPAPSPMADEYPPPEDVERAGELARERGWKDIGGQGVVSDPAKLHVPSSIDTFNPAGEPTAYPASSPQFGSGDNEGVSPNSEQTPASEPKEA